MSHSKRISQHMLRLPLLKSLARLVHTPLAIIALVCATVVVSPQANSQACGPSLTLAANQWTMVGIPCVPPTGSGTIGDVFGPSLGTEDYGVTWIAWKRVYDDNQCVVSSGPADCYIKLTLTSAATTGDAFWIYTTVEEEWQPGSLTASTTDAFVDIPVPLSTDGNSRYFMFANPYSDTIQWERNGDIRFTVTRGNGTTANFSALQAINRSIVGSNIHYWNGNTYYTYALDDNNATFKAKESAWLEMLQPTNTRLTTPASVRVSKP
jgi:hypothetical protein